MNPWAKMDALREAHERVLARAQKAADWLATMKYHSTRRNPAELQIDAQAQRWRAVCLACAGTHYKSLVMVETREPQGTRFAQQLEELAKSWEGFEPWTP